MSKNYIGPFKDVAPLYIEYKKSLGYDCKSDESALKRLDTYFYNQNIKDVKLTNCQIKTINYLSLDKLNLSNNNICLDGLKKLSNLLSDEKCSLTKLNLNNNLIGDDGCATLSEGIAKNNSLISLNLSANNILNKGVVEIAKSLRSETGNKTIKKLK